MKMPKLSWPKKKKPSRQPHLMQGQDEYIFRRSRTITGSVSPKVTVTSGPSNQLKTGRQKIMELRQHRRQILKMLSGVALAIGCLAFLIANLIVEPVIVIGQKGNKPAVNDYQQTINSYLGDHPFERLGFAIQKGGLEAALKQKHSEIASLTTLHDWYGGNVQFSLHFRKPLLVWRTAGEKFYVDGDGVAFKYNHFAEPKVSVTDESGLPPGESSIVASGRFIRFLGQTVSEVNKQGKGEVSSVIIPPSAREINIKLKGRNYIIRTHIDRDPALQAEDISFALTHFDKKGIKPKYVDVRVAHKAFYK